MRRGFAGVNLVIDPTLAVRPPLAGKREMELRNGPVRAIKGALLEICLANVLGTPAIAIATSEPVGPLPFSFQIMGARGSDHRLLELSGGRRGGLVSFRPLKMALRENFPHGH